MIGAFCLMGTTSRIDKGELTMKKKQIISFEASRELVHKARIAAAMRNESRSRLIRRAVEMELKRLEKESSK